MTLFKINRVAPRKPAKRAKCQTCVADEELESSRASPKPAEKVLPLANSFDLVRMEEGLMKGKSGPGSRNGRYIKVLILLVAPFEIIR